MKIYLDVPFEEKAKAKALGAKWDAQKQKWYAPNQESELIRRWPDTHNQSLVELKGENRSYGGNSLFVDLIPTSCWFTNVRYCLDPNSWHRLRKLVYTRANFRCECCGIEAKGNLDAHERWHFDLLNKVQKLVRIIALCKPCHEVTHFGFAMSCNRQEHALKHLMEVTGINRIAAKEHVQEACRLWEYRNQFEWDLDISIIENSGIKLSRRVLRDQRKKIAEEVLNKKKYAPKFSEEREEPTGKHKPEERIEYAQTFREAQQHSQFFQTNQADVNALNFLIDKIKFIKKNSFLWLLLPLLILITFQPWGKQMSPNKVKKNLLPTNPVKHLKKADQSIQKNFRKKNSNKHQQNKKKDPELQEMIDFINHGRIVEL